MPVHHVHWRDDIARVENFQEDVKSGDKICIFVTPEYEGIFKNGGIGTYYATLGQKLAQQGWYNILLLCQTQQAFQGQSEIPALRHIFSVNEANDVLDLHPIQQSILSRFQQWEWLERESYCALFFIQAIANQFPTSQIYIEFPDMCGLAYHTIQAKRAGVLGNYCVTAVTMHSGHEWIYEVNEKFVIEHPNWFRQARYYEQYSFENADLAFFLSHFLKSKVEQLGWKTDHALHLPYCFPIMDDVIKSKPLRHELEIHVSASIQTIEIPKSKVPIVFFGRLEDRKGLCTFVSALKHLPVELTRSIHLIFLGKIVTLYSRHRKHLDSRQYIEQEIGHKISYTINPDLFSQQAIYLVSQLHRPIVCLTSPEENFPNSSLEMGQLPVSLVVSKTGGFEETLGLIQRKSCVRWFQPRNSHHLAQTLEQAIAAYPEEPTLPDVDFLQTINQSLLAQKLEHIERSFHKETDCKCLKNGNSQDAEDSDLSLLINNGSKDA